ncbi:MAG: radical SAM protein [Pseudobdellovibrio sp.]
MNPLDLRRHNEIIAFKAEDNSITAFHAYNLEVAEISPESFAQMTPVPISTGEIPHVKLPNNPEEKEAFEALTVWNNEDNPNAKSGKLDFGVRSITLNVTQICNLKCTYCAAGGDGTYGEAINKISIEKTLPQLKFFIESLKPNQKFSVSFVGGEPLLYPEAIVAIHDYIFAEVKDKKFTPSLQIVTNGTLLFGKTLEMIRKLKIKLKFSLDGSKDFNDIARPTKNGQSSTDMVVDAIKKLAENRGNIESFGLSAVYSKNSPSLVDTYNFFETLHADWYDFTLDVAESDPILQQKFIDEFNQVAALAYQSGGEENLRKISTFNSIFSNLDSQTRLENYCGAGKTYFAIDAKNKVYTCVWSAGNSSEIVGEGKQLDYEALGNYSKSLIELNNCQSCWARHLCGGGCMHINKLKNGNKHKKDNLFCERTRGLILTALIYYKMSRLA